jgi:hypothetical protein
MTGVRGREDAENRDMGSSQPRPIFVHTGHGQVQEALARTLSRLLGGSAQVQADLPTDELPGAVVITSDTVCSPQECTSLMNRGADVIVLAALPRPTKRSEYLSAGVRAYLPMVLDLGPLLLAITATL